MKIAKTYRLEESAIEMIEKVAADEFSGNYTAALESMINQAYRMRQVDIREREVMYSSWGRVNKSHDHNEAKNVIDGLNI
ncbi:MAG: hypothetical protein ACRDD9_23445 [Shewanella sp.]